MKNKISALISAILCFLVVLSSAVTVTSAKEENANSLPSETVNITDSQEFCQPVTYSFEAEKYYAGDDDFDESLCTTDEDKIAADIRKGMAARKSKIELYYENSSAMDNYDFQVLIDNWFELAFQETDSTSEGDYLRLSYNSCNAYMSSKHYTGKTKYYNHITLTMDYYTTKAQETAVNKKIAEIIDGFDFTAETTDRKKIDTVYTYIIKNVKYDTVNPADYKLKYTAYGALFTGKAVCQGYATLLYKMARECGLKARVVTGESRKQNHAWNIVKLGDYYYYVDSTWDEGGEYNYYLKGSRDFGDHIPESRFFDQVFTVLYPISTDNYDISADGDVFGDFEYEIYMSNVKITKYNGKDKVIVIPSKIGDYQVKSLGTGAISENDTVETVTFSEGVTGMDAEAIHYCENLKEINFSSTMSIDFEEYDYSHLYGYTTAPIGCNKLEKITVDPENPKMTVINGILYTSDRRAVILCPRKCGKKEIVIASGVKTVAPRAFEGCDGIEKIVIPDTVRYIGYWAFSDIPTLTSANIPESCEIIAQFAFKNAKLTSLNVPADMWAIMSGAFGAYCKFNTITVDKDNKYYYMSGPALCRKGDVKDEDILIAYKSGDTAKEFTVPATVAYIEQTAITNTELEKIIIPNTVKEITPYGLMNNKKLSHIEFPSSITEIPEGALRFCDNLASIIVPSSITKIDFPLIGSGFECYTIYGEKGSAAESYCLENELFFKTIDKFVCPSGHTFKMGNSEDMSVYQYICEKCGDASQPHFRTHIGAAVKPVASKVAAVDYTGSKITPKVPTMSLNGVKLTEGKDYKVTYSNNVNPGTAKIKITGIGEYYGESNIEFEIKPVLNATAKLTSSLYGYNDVKLTWSKVSYADGYMIYYKKSSSSKYTYKTSTKSLSYKFANLASGTSYSFKIVAYRNDNGKKAAAKKYKTVSATTLKKVSTPKVKKYASGKIKITWTNIAGESGYQISKSTKKSGTSVVTTYNTTSGKSKVLKVKKGKTYYYKIRAYKKVDSKVIYAPWSTVKSYKLK